MFHVKHTVTIKIVRRISQFPQKWQIAPPIDVSYETFDSFMKKWLTRRPFCSMFHMKHNFAKQRISKTLKNRPIVRV